MTRARTSAVSKQLAWLLRHGAREAGLAMDAAGWAAVDDVLRALAVSRAEFDAAVRENNKSRYEVDSDRVRACQGHSAAGTGVTREALEASWVRDEGDARLWHGTRAGVVPAIARDGILPGARTHVHLAPAVDSVVGKRAEVEVLLGVDPARLRAHGLAVFVSGNGVRLVREVPVECVVDVCAASTETRRSIVSLRALFGLE